MGETIPYGSDVAGGTFECLDCGYGLQISSTESLPPCPYLDDEHTTKAWRTIYGRGEARS